MKRKYQQLLVWQKSMQLVQVVYAIALTFPEIEKFGLSSQIRRAVVSVPSNIAEGSGRGSDKDFVKFLFYARGSLTEVETQLLIAQQLGYIDIDTETDELIQHVFAMLNKLITTLNA